MGWVLLVFWIAMMFELCKISKGMGKLKDRIQQLEAHSEEIDKLIEEEKTIERE